MPAFGENLRREREMRGVSLEEISAATKISLRFLDAIEREEFNILPGGIFSRSFIRSYARYLGLDEERVVAEYQLAARPQVEFDLHRLSPGAGAGKRTTLTPLKATLLAMILLAGGYALFRYSTRMSEVPVPPPPPPVAETPKSPAPSSVPVPLASGDVSVAPGVLPEAGAATPATAPGTATPSGAPAVPGTTAAPGTATHPEGATAPGANPAAASTAQTPTTPVTNPGLNGDLVLQVAATDRTWVAVDADGKTVLQGVVEPNDVKTVKAHKSFDVTTGNAQSTILTLNGETLKPLGRRGEVKSVHLTRDDLKNSAP